MNKFLRKSVVSRPTPSPQRGEHESAGYPLLGGDRRLDVLEEFAACWSSLETARRKLRRSLMYTYEDQWGDYVTDPDTQERITESELIKRQGKVPLKNNMIAPIVKNIEGQFRNNISHPLCTVRDPREAKIGEMMTMAVEYVHDINEADDVDSDSLRLLLCGGFIGQRIECGWNEAKRMVDVWLYGCSPARMFFNTNVEDVRAWDLTHVGEIFDMPLNMVQSLFADSVAAKERIAAMYAVSDAERFVSDGMQGTQVEHADFYTPTRTDMCRVVFGWRLESRDAYYYHDTMKGTWGYVGMDEKSSLDHENASRREDAVRMGVSEEDVPLIEYEYKTELYWQYYYLSPYGDVLRTGRSPYWHGSHNYAVHFYTLVQGKAHNFIEDFIDQQRAINRTFTLIDFIRSSSSKGLLVVDDTAFEDMGRKEIVDEFVRYNGVLFAKLKPGQNISNVIQQVNGQAAVAGDFELLNLQLKLINDISGVNSAMQGKAPASGTAASLYAQQVQNSSLNLRGLFSSFDTFRRRRDYKVMQTVQQYYTPKKYIEIAGSNYADVSTYYNLAEKVQGSEIDLRLIENNQTPGYQMLMNDFLMQLYNGRAIDAITLLENSTYPFKDKIIESLRRNQQSGQMGNVPIPETDNSLMSQAMNDSYAGEDDGIVRRVA